MWAGGWERDERIRSEEVGCEAEFALGDKTRPGEWEESGEHFQQSFGTWLDAEWSQVQSVCEMGEGWGG
jgi:hypothetical protein